MSSTVGRRALPRLGGHLAHAAVDPFELREFVQPMTTRDAAAEADAILAEARATAAQMVEQARLLVEQDRAAARAAGFAEGHAQGLDEADREAAGSILAAEAIARNVAEERVRLLADAEGEVVELALAIAGRVVDAAIEVEPERVVDVCRGAMRKAFQRETLVVLAHPDDLVTLRAAGPAMAEQLGGVQRLEFVEERRLQRGGVVVRTPAGEIDASVDAKTDVIAAGLREAVAERRATAAPDAPAASAVPGADTTAAATDTGAA